MRTLTIIVAAAALSLAACKKKEDKAPAAAPAAAPTAPVPAPPAPPPAAGSMAAPAAGTDTAMANKAGNCPAAVVGATAELVEDAANPKAVVLEIIAKEPAAVDTIRKRAAHLVAVQAAPDAEVKHSGEGTGGSGAGVCPVMTSKDVTIAAADVEGGVRVTMTSTGAMTPADLAKEVVGRIDRLKAVATAAPTDDKGDGGGVGGGQGTHGGNHSGQGDGKGKEREAAKPQ
ncbi:MAG: hypothetical protein R3B06_31970 [Kofleriaceae bacterium]